MITLRAARVAIYADGIRLQFDILGNAVNAKGVQNWEKARAAGMLRFVLVRGVLSYGLTMFVVMTFIIHRSDLSPRFIVISALLWLAGGAIFGALTWLLMERIYRKVVPKIIA